MKHILLILSLFIPVIAFTQKHPVKLVVPRPQVYVFPEKRGIELRFNDKIQRQKVLGLPYHYYSKATVKACNGTPEYPWYDSLTPAERLKYLQHVAYPKFKNVTEKQITSSYLDGEPALQIHRRDAKKTSYGGFIEGCIGRYTIYKGRLISVEFHYSGRIAPFDCLAMLDKEEKEEQKWKNAVFLASAYYNKEDNTYYDLNSSKSFRKGRFLESVNSPDAEKSFNRLLLLEPSITDNASDLFDSVVIVNKWE